MPTLYHCTNCKTTFASIGSGDCRNCQISLIVFDGAVPPRRRSRSPNRDQGQGQGQNYRARDYDPYAPTYHPYDQGAIQNTSYGQTPYSNPYQNQGWTPNQGPPGGYFQPPSNYNYGPWGPTQSMSGYPYGPPGNHPPQWSPYAPPPPQWGQPGPPPPQWGRSGPPPPPHTSFPSHPSSQGPTGLPGAQHPPGDFSRSEPVKHIQGNETHTSRIHLDSLNPADVAEFDDIYRPSATSSAQQHATDTISQNEAAISNITLNDPVTQTQGLGASRFAPTYAAVAAQQAPPSQLTQSTSSVVTEERAETSQGSTRKGNQRKSKSKSKSGYKGKGKGKEQDDGEDKPSSSKKKFVPVWCFTHHQPHAYANEGNCNSHFRGFWRKFETELGWKTMLGPRWDETKRTINAPATTLPQYVNLIQAYHELFAPRYREYCAARDIKLESIRQGLKDAGMKEIYVKHWERIAVTCNMISSNAAHSYIAVLLECLNKVVVNPLVPRAAASEGIAGQPAQKINYAIRTSMAFRVVKAALDSNADVEIPVLRDDAVKYLADSINKITDWLVDAQIRHRLSVLEFIDDYPELKETQDYKVGFATCTDMLLQASPEPDSFGVRNIQYPNL